MLCRSTRKFVKRTHTIYVTNLHISQLYTLKSHFVHQKFHFSTEPNKDESIPSLTDESQNTNDSTSENISTDEMTEEEYKKVNIRTNINIEIS